MVDQNNIRGLVQDLSELLDRRMEVLREGTVLGSVRPSDAKVFMLASRHSRTTADIARDLGVSKQAVHMSVQRLKEKDVVRMVPAENSNRDKVIEITERGQEIRGLVAKKIAIIEAEIEAKLGKGKTKEFRQSLLKLLEP
ncbi:MAG: winged helix-turn-helix transcriptional regulator [Cognatishimia sp.]|uniref:winged helix DNA-binding protein n=1 Tax=Cognatishimia sp. TaxID=2211648 RepID=UPI003B8B3D45